MKPKTQKPKKKARRPGESKYSPRRVVAYERQIKALELRKAGITYDGIAKELGYESYQAAYEAVKSALDKMMQEPAEEVRKIELRRLDRMLQAKWKQVEAGDDKSISTVLSIHQRICSLNGIEAPLKIAPTDPSGQHAFDGVVILRAGENGKDGNGHDGNGKRTPKKDS